MDKEELEYQLSDLVSRYAYYNGVEIQSIRIAEVREDSVFGYPDAKSYMVKVD